MFARLLLIILPLCVLVAPARAADAPRRVFIAGDSTAAEYGPERAPRNGWGQQLQGFLDPAWFEVRNHAAGGRSSRSFIEEGRLDPIAKALRKGDVLLIQFGHNDAKYEDPRRYNEPAQAYPQWLMRYVAVAREHGATPILLTPASRRVWDFGSLLDTHARYTQAVRDLAAREQVALIDLNASSTDWLRALGDEPSKAYFEHVRERDLRDDTHFSVAGATMVACLGRARLEGAGSGPRRPRDPRHRLRGARKRARGLRPRRRILRPWSTSAITPGRNPGRMAGPAPPPPTRCSAMRRGCPSSCASVSCTRARASACTSTTRTRSTTCSKAAAATCWTGRSTTSRPGMRC